MNTRILIAVFGFCIFVGCQPKEIFYWDDYSETLYALKKSPDEKTLKSHKEMLVKIITGAGGKKMRIPPGVHAEYGYLLLKAGREAEGMDYLDRELNIYPESRVFILRLRNEYARGKK